MRPAAEAGTNSPPRTARERLSDYLARRYGASEPVIIPLTPDASTREYFRIPWDRKTAVAAVYPEPFDPEFHPYLDVTRLFRECSLPVPEVYAVEGRSGIIVQEDLGDDQLCRVFETVTEDEREAYLDQAIRLIARIQGATEVAITRQSISSRLAFDEVKLSWELRFFMDHYFGSLRGEELRHAEAAELKAELNDISVELAARPRVLCHRDYHSANLLLDKQGHLRIVDHQDARMGPASYDLVSLVLDRQPKPPSLAALRAHRLYLIEERRRCGLPSLDPDEFSREFRLMTVQRGLKAIGTFSYQTAVCGRGELYESFIQPTFQIVMLAAQWLERFPVLQRAITERIE
jgi:aminoglycoside/choline kinase family phosphotransferase